MTALVGAGLLALALRWGTPASATAQVDPGGDAPGNHGSPFRPVRR